MCVMNGLGHDICYSKPGKIVSEFEASISMALVVAPRLWALDLAKISCVKYWSRLLNTPECVVYHEFISVLRSNSPIAAEIPGETSLKALISLHSSHTPCSRSWPSCASVAPEAGLQLDLHAVCKVYMGVHAQGVIAVQIGGTSPLAGCGHDSETTQI